MKPLARTLLSLGFAAATSCGAFGASVPVTAGQIPVFKGKQTGEPVDGVIWRGGIVMSSQDSRFGGHSGIAFTGAGNQLAMVSDEGWFVSGRLIYGEQGRPLSFSDVAISAIQNSKGAELPRKFAKDAEAIDTIYRQGKPAAVRVGFENLTRVADFELVDGRPQGAAREVAIPDWLEKLRTNNSLEVVCIAPPASPVAGSTLLITEGARAGDGYAGYMLGHKDKGPLTISRTRGVNPTDCGFLPNGDLLVLERGVSFLSFTMQVRLIEAEAVQPGREMTGRVILSASGADIDNMEGLAVHPGPDGEPRITIVSDDNYNGWERSLLLEFSLPEPKE